MKIPHAMMMVLALSGPAFAANTSTYSTFDIKTYKMLDKPVVDEEFAGSFLCKGITGQNIFFSEGDLRSLVAFGKAPKTHCAASQTFGGFNSTSTKVEWRLANGKPIATILRWSVSYDPADSTKTKTYLVVTKLEPANSCHMAIIEGAMPNANAQARKLADDMAQTFSCKAGREVILSTRLQDQQNMNTSSGCQ